MARGTAWNGCADKRTSLPSICRRAVLAAVAASLGCSGARCGRCRHRGRQLGSLAHAHPEFAEASSDDADRQVHCAGRHGVEPCP